MRTFAHSSVGKGAYQTTLANFKKIIYLKKLLQRFIFLFCMYEYAHMHVHWVHGCGGRKRVLAPYIRKVENHSCMLFPTIVPSRCKSRPKMVGTHWCWLNHVWKQVFGPESDREQLSINLMSVGVAAMFPELSCSLRTGNMLLQVQFVPVLEELRC